MSLLTPDLGRRARQTRFNPIRNLSPATLASALDRFDAGHLRSAALLWEVIEDRDDVLQICGAKRRKKVSRRPWEVLPVDDSAEAKKHAETLKDFFNNLTVTEAADENVLGGFRLLLRQMMNAAFHKYAVHEIVWSMAGGKLRAELRFAPLYFFSNTAGRLGYVGPEGGGIDGQALPANEWLITTGDSALMKAASVCYVFKRLSLQDWLNFSEKFGIPGIHGETPAAKGTAEFDDFVNALDAFASDWVTATNAGAKINLIEASQNGDGPFAPMVERMDRRLTSLVLGSDLSTMSRENGVGANPQQADSDQLLEDDCEMISETLQMKLSRAVIQYVHGTSEPLAYLKILPPIQRDTTQEIAVDQFLLDNGGELDAQQTFERYDRTPAKTMQKGAVLKKAPAPVAPGNRIPESGDRKAFAAANDTTAQPLLQNALARALGVVPQWLSPVADLIASIEAKAGSGISDAELLDFTEAAANRLPELFHEIDPAGLADELEAAMGTAVINSVTAALRKQAPLKKAA